MYTFNIHYVEESKYITRLDVGLVFDKDQLIEFLKAEAEALQVTNLTLYINKDSARIARIGSNDLVKYLRTKSGSLAKAAKKITIQGLIRAADKAPYTSI